MLDCNVRRDGRNLKVVLKSLQIPQSVPNFPLKPDHNSLFCPKHFTALSIALKKSSAPDLCSAENLPVRPASSPILSSIASTLESPSHQSPAQSPVSNEGFHDHIFDHIFDSNPDHGHDHNFDLSGFDFNLDFEFEPTFDPDLDQHSQKANISPLRTPESPKKRVGRPEGFSLQDRSKLAYLIATCNSSISQAGKSLFVGKVDLEQSGEFQDNSFASEQTATRALQESYLSVSMDYARKLSQSIDLYLGVDCYSDRTERNLISVKFGGCHPQMGLWSFLVALEEMPEGHGGERQARTILDRLNFIQSLQAELSLSKTELWEFKLIVYDNTSSNTGKISGLFAHLEKLRKESWEQLSETLKARFPYKVLFS